MPHRRRLRWPFLALAAVCAVLPAEAQRGARKGDSLTGGDAQKLEALGYTEGAVVERPGQKLPAPNQPEKVTPTAVQVRAEGRVVEDPKARARALVQQVVNVERAHRERIARIERLEELFRASGGADSLAELANLRAVQERRYQAAMDGYRRDLGADNYARLRKVLDAGGGPPAAPPVGKEAREDGETRRKRR